MFAHGGHTEKQNTETGNNLSGIFRIVLFAQGNHKGTNADKNRHILCDIKGKNQAGNGGTNGRTHQYTHGLTECHQARIDEADNHDRNRSRTLDDGGNNNTNQCA